MKKALALVLLLLLLPAAAHGAEIKVVEALGKAPAGDNEASARQSAVNDALAQAVGRVAMEMVDPATLRQKLGDLQDKVLAKAGSFVATYTLVAEAKAGQTVLALVRAKVDRKALGRALAGAGLRLPELKMAQVLVLVAEETAPARPPVYWWSGAPGAPPAPPPVAAVLHSLGVETVDPAPLAASVPAEARNPVLSEDQALALGRQAGARLVIMGRVRTYPMVTPENELPPPVAQLMALDVEKGKAVSIVEAEGPAFHQTPGPASTDQVTQAVELATRQLLEQVAAAGPVQAAGASQITVHLSGITSLVQLNKFEQALTSLSPLVSSVRRSTVGAGWAEFAVTLAGPPSKLADRLLVTDYGDFLINVVDVAPNEIKLVLLPKS